MSARSINEKAGDTVNEFKIAYRGGFGNGQTVEIDVRASTVELARRWAHDSAPEGWVYLGIKSRMTAPPAPTHPSGECPPECVSRAEADIVGSRDAAARGMLRARVDEVERLTRERGEWEALARRMESERNESREAIHATRDLIERVTRERDAARDMAQTYEQELTWEKGKIEHLTRERDELEAIARWMESERNEARGDLETSTAALDKVIGERDAANERCSVLEGDRDRRSADIERLADEHQRAHSDKFEAIRERDAANESSNELKRDLQRVLNENVSLRAVRINETDTLTGERDAANERARRFEKQRDDLRECLNHESRRAERFEKRRDKLQDALNAAQLRIMELTAGSKLTDDIDNLAELILAASTDESAHTLARALLWGRMKCTCADDDTRG